MICFGVLFRRLGDVFIFHPFFFMLSNDCLVEGGVGFASLGKGGLVWELGYFSHR